MRPCLEFGVLRAWSLFFQGLKQAGAVLVLPVVHWANRQACCHKERYRDGTDSENGASKSCILGASCKQER